MKIIGKVIKGDGLARAKFGIPTANLSLAEPSAVAPGVYVAHAWVESDRRPALVCVGSAPRNKFEVHVFQFDEDLYGQDLKVEILEKISDFVLWENEDQMKTKIEGDMERAKTFFGLKY